MAKKLFFLMLSLSVVAQAGKLDGQVQPGSIQHLSKKTGISEALIEYKLELFVDHKMSLDNLLYIDAKVFGKVDATEVENLFTDYVFTLYYENRADVAIENLVAKVPSLKKEYVRGQYQRFLSSSFPEEVTRFSVDADALALLSQEEAHARFATECDAHLAQLEQKKEERFSQNLEEIAKELSLSTEEVKKMVEEKGLPIYYVTPIMLHNSQERFLEVCRQGVQQDAKKAKRKELVHAAKRANDLRDSCALIVARKFGLSQEEVLRSVVDCFDAGVSFEEINGFDAEIFQEMQASDRKGFFEDQCAQLVLIQRAKKAEEDRLSAKKQELEAEKAKILSSIGLSAQAYAAKEANFTQETVTSSLLRHLPEHLFHALSGTREALLMLDTLIAHVTHNPLEQAAASADHSDKADPKVSRHKDLLQEEKK